MVEQLLKNIKLLQELFRLLLIKSGGISDNQERISYAPWLKEAIIKLHDKGCPYKIIELATGISVKTMENFKITIQRNMPQKRPLSELHQLILSAWNKSKHHQRKYLYQFRYHLDVYYPEIKISFNELRQVLIDLGLKYPRGPKIKDEGATVKKKFDPHTIWEGDGKQMTIVLNGEIFQYCWYAFIDQSTTLLVGSSVTNTESSASFLKALKEGKKTANFFAMGVLIDNRMPESELSSVQEFCKEYGITIVRTFPGNSKSNGHIENNFGIFERQVSQIFVQGRTPDDIARSIAKNIIEIFTQQRNHSSRKKLGGRTPAEVNDGNIKRPEHTKSALEALRDRFQKEEINIDNKFKIVEGLLSHFLPFSNESLDKFKRTIKKYSDIDLIAATASFLGQKSKHPDEQFGPEYFLAILRNKREQRAKETYNESFRAGMDMVTTLPASFQGPDASKKNMEKSICESIAKALEMPSEAQKLCYLEAMAWWMVEFSVSNDLPKLWRKLGKEIERSIQFSLKTCAQVVEFFYNLLGGLLLEKRGPPTLPIQNENSYCQ